MKMIFIITFLFSQIGLAQNAESVAKQTLISPSLVATCSDDSDEASSPTYRIKIFKESDLGAKDQHVIVVNRKHPNSNTYKIFFSESLDYKKQEVLQKNSIPVWGGGSFFEIGKFASSRLKITLLMEQRMVPNFACVIQSDSLKYLERDLQNAMEGYVIL
jgi:hypothetical protein